MLRELPSRPVPDWINPSRLHEGPLPIRDILDRSVYYPACGLDPDPVLGLVGNFHSFIYVDYAVGRQRLSERLLPLPGYGVEASREIDLADLPSTGWSPVESHSRALDPNAFADSQKPPFAVWSIQRCLFPLPLGHPAERFSLLYIGGEGVQTFHSLYYGTRAAPAVVAVIRPGHSFGLNWTNFEAEHRIFARVVLDSPFGAPEFLINSYLPCWRRYSQPIAALNSNRGLWLHRLQQADATASS